MIFEQPIYGKDELVFILEGLLSVFENFRNGSVELKFEWKTDHFLSQLIS